MKDKPVTRGPMPAVWGSWDSATKQRPPKKKAAPIFTEERLLRVADAIAPEDRNAISERAKEAAARIMADFEMRRGR